MYGNEVGDAETQGAKRRILERSGRYEGGTC